MGNINYVVSPLLYINCSDKVKVDIRRLHSYIIPKFLAGTNGSKPKEIWQWAEIEKLM